MADRVSQSLVLCVCFVDRSLSFFFLSIVLSVLPRFTDSDYPFQGRTQGRGGAPGARSPKIGNNMIFWRKIVIFHTKYPKIFAPPSARRNFFKCAPHNLKSWIRPCLWYLQTLLRSKKLTFRTLIIR